MGINSNVFFLKDNKKAFILWLNAPKVTAYGDRQTGRVKSSSILDVRCTTEAITHAILFAISHKDEQITDTPYYREHSAELYYQTTKNILHDEKPKYKKFFDIKPLNV